MNTYEYFCKDCGQLRLCLNPKLKGCGNCGSLRIIRGSLESLPKDKLKDNFKRGMYKREGKGEK
jgi:hypothetical protein